MMAAAFGDIAARASVAMMRAPESGTRTTGERRYAMYDPPRWFVQPTLVEPQAYPLRSACLVPGCPCKDARIVSQRRAAFYAVVARTQGETADRTIAPDPEWRLPLLVA
jgi:hypothetical protein